MLYHPALPHPRGFISLRTTTVRNGPTSTLYPRAGCDGNSEHVLCGVPVANSSSCSPPQEQPASSLASMPVNRRYPPLLLMLRHIHKGGVLNEPPPLPTLHSIISDVFLSANPTLPLFLPPPPSTTWVGGEKKKSQNNNKQAAWFFLSLVVVLLSVGGGVVFMHPAQREWMMQASRPVHRPDVCRYTPYQTHCGEYVPVCLLCHS